MSVGLALIAMLGLAWVFLRPRQAPGPQLDAPSPPDPRALPGGRPEQAFVVSSPAVIETRASEDPCQACGARVHCDHHRVEVHGDLRYRVADLRCAQCGFERAIYFVLQT